MINLRTEEVRHEVSIIEENIGHLKTVLRSSTSKVDYEPINERIVRQ